MNSKTKIINKEFDPLIFQTIITRYWYWPLIFLLLLLGLAFVYLRYTKPVYESNLIIQIDNQDKAKDILQTENLSNIPTQQDEIASKIELIKSQFLFEKAIQKINYNVSLYSKGSVLTEERYLNSNFNIQPYELKDSSIIGIPIYVTHKNNQFQLEYNLGGKKFQTSGQENEHFISKHFDVILKAPNMDALIEEMGENELYFTFNSVNSFASKYLASLQVNPIDPLAKTIQISFKSNNAQLSHDICLAVANEFFQYDNDYKKKSNENILEFINNQLDSLAGELEKSKDSLLLFQKKSNLPNPDDVGTNLSSNISKVQDEIFIVDEEIRTLRNIDLKLSNEPNRLDVYRILPDMLGKSYENSLSGQIESLHALLEKKEDLLFKATEENSEVKLLNSKIQNKLYSIRKSVSVILERLLSKSRSLRAKVAGFEGEFFEIPEKKMEFSRLKNIQDLNEKFYSLLTENKVRFSISNAGFSSANRILNKPVVAIEPISPNRKLIYISFTLIALILGLGIMLIKYLTFNDVNMLEDLKNLLPLQASVLGSVPKIHYTSDFSQLVVHQSPKSILSEALRKIRTNLNYIHPYYQTIAISSTISGEGKTFVALNLAGIIAMSGKKTILIDLDLRKPKVHLGLNVPNHKGMSGLIIQQYPIQECIQHSEIDKLDFITAGPIPPNPSELLLSDRFKEIIKELKITYDVIIIDNPPIGLVSDGIKNLTDADIPIYVFKSHYSKRNYALRLKELFEMNQLNSLNVILNAEKISRISGYGYGYGYSYGYYDQSSDEKSNWFQKLVRHIRKIFSKNGN